MKLSVIIVNYNVTRFLEQALHAVYKSLKNIDGEVIVVDNHSTDGSIAMLAAKFPETRVIANSENLGFAKANNLAIRQAQGEYVLLLNPDTLIEEDTLEKCIAFMDATPDAGSLGVKMVNGKGQFLPESKRGIPFPSVAFYKIFGLSRLFSNSKKFGGYYLTYLSKDEIHPVDVLSGAFMMLRHSVIDKIGLLDEEYFMYGEDIDLSYRITKSGYRNYYFPETRIIHYKGESTKKDSLRHVRVFYKAMQIFARRHIYPDKSWPLRLMITLAIWFRASLAAAKRIFSVLLLPILDFIGIYAGMLCFACYWENVALIQPHGPFSPTYLFLIVPLYVLIWLLSTASCKGYHKPMMPGNVNKGIAIGTIIIFLIYALLPESCRYSRAIIVFGTMWTIIFVNLLRYSISQMPFGKGLFNRQTDRRAAIVCNPEEGKRVRDMVRMMNAKYDFVGLITIEPTPTKDMITMGNISQIRDLTAIYRINEVIFCSKNLSVHEIIDWMEQLQTCHLDYKIAPENSSSIIGSNSVLTLEETTGLPPCPIMQKEDLRRKRAFDIASSVAILLLLAVDIWLVENKKHFLQNLFQVATGKKSWVGCQTTTTDNTSPYPLKQGVLFPTDAFDKRHFSDDLIAKAVCLYTRDYKVRLDMQILYRNFRQLGRK